MTVDGGSDHWLSWLEQHNINDSKIPDILTGDMDSIQEETLNYFHQKGTKIIKTPNQNETDFTKSLMELISHVANEKLKVSLFIIVNNIEFKHTYLSDRFCTGYG